MNPGPIFDAGDTPASELVPLPPANMPECSRHHLLGIVVEGDERRALVCCHDNANERSMPFELPEAFIRPGDGENPDQFYARVSAHLDRCLKAVFN